MAEGILARLTRKYSQAVLPTFQRAAIGRYIPAENIGDRDVTKWAVKVLKETPRPVDSPAGGNWNAEEDKFDLLDANWHLHKLNKRMTMNRSERTMFEKNGILPVGVEDIATQMANEFNYIICRGARSDSQFPIVQYNYITDQSASSTTPQRPSLGTATPTGNWRTAAGAAITDVGIMLGKMRVYGFNPATTLFMYPEVCEGNLRAPLLTTTSTYTTASILDYIKTQCLGVLPLKDELLYTAAGATPTTSAWDAYMVDVGAMVIGYTVPENINVQPPNHDYNTFIDAETEFCPLFKPLKYDGDTYYYKGVMRTTAVAIN